MVQSGKTPQEFIQYSFSPMVAVLSTPTVDSIVSKNNLSFVELLQPFCQLQSEGHVRDPSGTQCTVRNWRLIVSDVHTKPPQPTVARKLLNDAVSLQTCYQTINIQSGNYKIDIPSATPWFDKWRETYFNVQFPSDHEFTKHYVSCMLVGSTSDSNLAESFSSLIQQLTQLQNVAPPKLPKWFNNSTLRCYVLVHDVSGSVTLEKGERLFESLKQAYGAGNCFFLSINSKSSSSVNDPPLPDLWSQYILSRSESNPELGSSRNSLPRTPVDARAISSLPSTLSTGSADDPTTSPSVVTPPEGSPHPLSPAGDPAISTFDGATNLQNDLSGSVESVTGFINANVWETTTLANSPVGVVHGTVMTLHDIENVKTFMNDFAFKALLPYFERQISQLHDAVANKKGVSRSLLSATKRWFGTNKPGTTTNVNTVIYTADCSELQLRKMGDMWFMLGQWNNAFQAYHTAKREFNADSAWLCYAGALEMAALSAFMSNESTRKTYDYMEESIMTYFTTCRMVQYAVRATLLSVLCLNSKGLHGEAAKQLIRMTSEDSDLRSAVLLEQAALCFLSGPPRRTMPRKYSFHMVLAGHRFTKAGQKKHALRCYKQAFQIYGNSGWRLAQDHVQFARGRLAGQLGAAAESAEALAAPLALGSPQPPAQQAQLLREYMLAHQKWMDSSPEYRTALPLLPLPLLLSNETVVLCGGIAPLSAPGRVAASGTALQQADDISSSDTNYWPKLEEMLVQTAKGTAPMIFRPTTSLFHNTTDNTSKPIVPQGEPVQVLVQLQNPLKIPVTLVDLQLLWSFQSDEDSQEQVITNEYYLASTTEMVNLAVATQTISNTVIHGNATSSVPLSITPLKSGELTLLGVAFKLCNTVEGSTEPGNGLVIAGKQMFNIRGPKLKNNKDSSKEYGLDRRLQITVTSPAPCLQVTFSEITSDLLCGELQRIDVELRNVGPVHMKSLYVAMSHPQYISFDTENNNFSLLREELYDTPTTLQDERQMRNYREQHWRRLHVRSVLAELSAGRKHSMQLWLRAPHCVQQEPHMLHLLFYYESVNSDPVPKYRLMRHTMTIKVQESVKIMAIPRHSLKFSEDRCNCQEVISLSVDVKNANNTEDSGSMQIQVLNASFLSRQWVLRSYVPLGESNKLLNSREKMHLILRGERCRNIENDSPINIISSDLRISENDPISKMGVGEVPYVCFVTEFSSPFKSNNFELSNAENSSGKNVSVHSTLVVRWKALVSREKGSTRTVIGQHYLWLDNFQRKICSQPEIKLSQNADVSVLKLFGCDDSTLLSSVGVHKPSPQEGENYVAYKLEHSREVNHDFRSRKICMVPVKVHVVNCIGQTVVAYVDMSHLSNNIGWVGVVSGHSEGVKVVLDPYQSSSISVNAICTSPGTYLLGNTFQISCQIDVSDGSTSSLMKQSCVATSLLVVNQT